jgi:hypothetical protein
MNFKHALAIAVTLSTCVLAWPAKAQVVFPRSPAELVAMANDVKYLKDFQHRAFVSQAFQYALSREASATSKPYTTAFQNWLAAQLAGDPRATHIFQTQVAQSAVTRPIDLYLLMGQSNMVGLTESVPVNGPYNGPDPEIQAALQARTPNRTVVTLNCALGASGLGAWLPATTSFSLEGKERHNLTRECIEAARAIRNRGGNRARIRGMFFYQGETDAAVAASWNAPQVIDNWPIGYAEVVEFVRDEFGDIPAVHAQIATVVSSDANYQMYWRLMQDAQATVSSRLPRSAMIVTKDLQLCDFIHLNDASQAIAGQRFATAMLSLL